MVVGLRLSVVSASWWCAALATSTPLRAQVGDSAPLVLSIPSSTRALAMGHAFVLSARDSDALFANPALLARPGGSAAAIQRFSDASTSITLATSRSWASGGLAFGAQVLDYGAPSSNLADLPADQTALLNSGATGAAELVGSIGYGREVAGFYVGVAAKLVEQRLGGDRDATVGFDVGAAGEVGPVTLGLTAQNLGPGLAMNGADLPLPHTVTLGAATDIGQVGPLDVLLATAVTRRRDGEVIPGGGVEVSWWPIQGRTFTGRVGIRRVPDGEASPFTFGFAFTGDNLAVEYAFQAFDVPGASHRFGFRWR